MNKEAFGEWVREVIGPLSLRQARNRTGVDIDTIQRMRQDEVPRVDKVIDFARGFGEDVNEALVRAGYPPVETGSERFRLGLRALCEEFDRPIPVDLRGGQERLTLEEAEKVLADLRRQLEEGAI